MIRIANAVVANAYASNDGFPSERHERMADLAYMIGIWDLTSKATSDGGELLEARGTRSCVWVLDRTAIRCDDSVDAIRATADYPGLYENHDQLECLAGNMAHRQFRARGKKRVPCHSWNFVVLVFRFRNDHSDACLYGGHSQWQ